MTKNNNSSRTQRRNIFTALGALAVVSLFAGGVALVASAPANAADSGKVTDVSFAKQPIQSGERAQISASWEFPDNPTTPATFSLPLPDDLPGRAESFALTEEGDSSVSIGSCEVTPSAVNCKLDDGYVASHPLGLKGNLSFWSEVKLDVKESTKHDFDFGSVTVPAEVVPAQVCTNDCTDPWDFAKIGYIDYADNVATWWARVKAPEGGMAGGENVRVTDRPGAGQTLVISDGFPALQRTKEKAVEKDGILRPSNFQNVPRDQYTVSSTGDVSFVAEKGYYYQVELQTKLIERPENGASVTNSADFFIDSESPTTTVVGKETYSGGIGVGIGTGVGTFSITKQLAGLPAAQLEKFKGLTFKGTYTVTPASGAVSTGQWAIKAGETFTPAQKFAAGSSVHLTEEPTPGPDGIEWAPATFSKNDFVIEADGNTSVVLTNTPSVMTNVFSVVKKFSGPAAHLVPANTEFTVKYAYDEGVGFPAGSGSFVVKGDGTPVLSPKLPVGAQVSLTEVTGPAVAGVKWGSETFSPSSVLITESGVTAVTLTNAVEGVTVPTPTPPAPTPDNSTGVPTGPTTSPAPETSTAPAAPASHDTTTGGTPLAITGNNVSPAVALGALALLVAGGTVLVARRRLAAARD